MSESTGRRNPVPTVDAIIEIGHTIVLVQRKHEPVGWALPGGFVDYGESLGDAAMREAKEETNLDIELLELFHAYSDPSRDARQHTISTVFLARAKGEPRGGDDAAVAKRFARDKLPSPIVFDHAQILEDYFNYRDCGERPPPHR